MHGDIVAIHVRASEGARESIVVGVVEPECDQSNQFKQIVTAQ